MSIAEWFPLVVNLSRRIKIEIYPPPSTILRAGPGPGSAVPAGPLLINAGLSLSLSLSAGKTQNIADLELG